MFVFLIKEMTIYYPKEVWFLVYLSEIIPVIKLSQWKKISSYHVLLPFANRNNEPLMSLIGLM